MTWNQASDPVKVEFENHFNQAYALTNTPRISFDQLRGRGNALSGVSFRYVFMSTYIAIENHGESIGPFMQRRVNFLISALGSINTNFEKASETIDVDVDLVPYMIDNLDDKVKTAVSKNRTFGGCSSGVAAIFFVNILSFYLFVQLKIVTFVKR